MLEAYVALRSHRVAKRTLVELGISWRRWKRLTGIDTVDTATCERFRTLWTGSPVTCENTIRHVIHLNKYVNGVVVNPGEPLRQPAPQPSLRVTEKASLLLFLKK